MISDIILLYTIYTLFINFLFIYIFTFSLT